MAIKEFTICLQCGCSKDVVNSQMDALKLLENEYKIYWNNRIDRGILLFDSWSEMTNVAIITSLTEYLILINDRTVPTIKDVRKIIGLLESGYAVVMLVQTGFMGFSKQVIRKIGWFDERFVGGGYEDDDFILRIKLADLCYYESVEAEYDQSWKSPLQGPKGGDKCRFSKPEFDKKWKITDNEIRRVIQEEDYVKYKNKLGDPDIDIEKSWKSWKYSQLGIMYKEKALLNSGGFSKTAWFLKDDYKTEIRKVTSV